MGIKIQIINTEDTDSAPVFWSVILNNHEIAIAKVACVDIYTFGHVYDITMYYPEHKIKILFKRIKSPEDFLVDEQALKKYLEDGCHLCIEGATLGYYRSAMSLEECEAIKKLLQ